MSHLWYSAKDLPFPVLALSYFVLLCITIARARRLLLAALCFLLIGSVIFIVELKLDAFYPILYSETISGLFSGAFVVLLPIATIQARRKKFPFIGIIQSSIFLVIATGMAGGKSFIFSIPIIMLLLAINPSPTVPIRDVIRGVPVG